MASAGCGGLPIHELGIELTAGQRLDGELTLRHLDWHGAPECFAMGRADELSPDLTPWTTNTPWLKAFLSSARNLAPDYTTTFSISHPGDNGVLTIGTRDWDDYTVSSELTLVHQRTAGLVARARGHRRYYAAVLCGGEARLVKRRDGAVQVLAQCPCAAPLDQPLPVALTVAGDRLRFVVAGRVMVTAQDSEYASGGAGFLVEEGGYLACGFRVERVPGDSPSPEPGRGADEGSGGRDVGERVRRDLPARAVGHGVETGSHEQFVPERDVRDLPWRADEHGAEEGRRGRLVPARERRSLPRRADGHGEETGSSGRFVPERGVRNLPRRAAEHGAEEASRGGFDSERGRRTVLPRAHEHGDEVGRRGRFVPLAQRRSQPALAPRPGAEHGG